MKSPNGGLLYACRSVSASGNFFDACCSQEVQNEIFLENSSKLNMYLFLTIPPDPQYQFWIVILRKTDTVGPEKTIYCYPFSSTLDWGILLQN